MEHIIKYNNLTHCYGKRLIYENLSFTVPKGRVLGLLGKNDTGKTTTISILSGYLKPRSRECRIFRQEIRTMTPTLRRNIGLLIEGHMQYRFVTINEIEKFYAALYPGQRRKEAYYELVNKLKVATGQCISHMSYGQRSQVILELVLVQNPELLVLDDFSLGLDPSYHRLFVDYLRDYVRSEGRTVSLTSHIIQDMERLVDDCIIMDYGKILIQKPIAELLERRRRYTFTIPEGYELPASDDFCHPSVMRNQSETFSFLQPVGTEAKLRSMSVPYTNFHSEQVNLEGAFIGLTGKYQNR